MSVYTKTGATDVPLTVGLSLTSDIRLNRFKYIPSISIILIRSVLGNTISKFCILLTLWPSAKARITGRSMKKYSLFVWLVA